MERSQLGIYLGVSNEHASTVSLLLTPRTGLVSPQFHVKWDDKFETVTNNPLMKEVGRWQEITQIHKMRRTREPSKRTRRISVTTTDDLKQQSHNNNERKATSEGDNERNATKSNPIQGDERSSNRPGARNLPQRELLQRETRDNERNANETNPNQGDERSSNQPGLRNVPQRETRDKGRSKAKQLLDTPIRGTRSTTQRGGDGTTEQGNTSSRPQLK